MRRVTVYGEGGYLPDRPDSNVVEEFEVQDDEPNDYDLADTVIVPSKIRQKAGVVGVPAGVVAVAEVLRFLIGG